METFWRMVVLGVLVWLVIELVGTTAATLLVVVLLAWLVLATALRMMGRDRRRAELRRLRRGR